MRNSNLKATTKVKLWTSFCLCAVYGIFFLKVILLRSFALPYLEELLKYVNLPFFWMSAVVCWLIVLFGEYISLFNSEYSNEDSDKIYSYFDGEPRYLTKIVEDLCIKRQINLPRILLISNDDSPVGIVISAINKTVVRLDERMFETASPVVIKGIAAHEFRHVEDTQYFTKVLYHLLCTLS